MNSCHVFSRLILIALLLGSLSPARADLVAHFRLTDVYGEVVREILA